MKGNAILLRASLLVAPFALASLLWAVHRSAGADEALEDVTSRLETRRAELREMRDAQALARVMTRNEAAVEQIGGRFAERHSQGDLILAFNSAVETSGVKILRDDYLVEEAGNGIAVIRHAVNTLGSYAETKKFLAKLDEMPGMTLIGEVAIEKLRAADQLSGHIQVATFYASDSR